MPLAASDRPPGQHLLVIQHGLWGQSKNMEFLKGLLEKAVADKDLPVVILNSNVNELYLTYEGFDACGDRLVTLIKETCQEHAENGRPITHLSLIGYSMGGLIVRYTAGKLYTAGLLKESSPSKGAFASVKDASGLKPLTPVNFVTIATPHLGTWVQPTSWFGRTVNSMVPRVAARSGTQFMLLDRHAFGRPLLVNMSDPELPFMKGLSTFKHLMLLANTLHDRTVPYRTAAISEENPYETHDSVPLDPAYPSIVKPAPRLNAQPPCRPVCRREAAPAQDEARQRQRARKGLGVRVLVLVLFPLTIPLAIALLCYMVMVGRRQWAAVLSRTFDHSWVEAAAPARLRNKKTALTAASLAPSQPTQPTQPTLTASKDSFAATADPASVTLLPATTSTATTTSPTDTPFNSSGFANGAEDPWAFEADGEEPFNEQGRRDVLTTLVGSAIALPRPETHSTSVRQSFDQAVTAERAGSQRVEVTIDGGARELHVHDGLVDTAGREREAQLWMMRQLNKLPWHKVDVDTRHYHAHAAIILRMPKKFMANKDCMQYLVDHMVLDVLDT